jgi:hypothetical protein
MIFNFFMVAEDISIASCRGVLGALIMRGIFIGAGVGPIRVFTGYFTSLGVF